MAHDIHVFPVGNGRGETWRYAGPLGDAEFEAGTTWAGGRPVVRDGAPVWSVSIASLRWAGARAGEAMSDEDRTALTGELRRFCAAKGPFELRLPSGEVEDETGTVRPGFKTGLPRVEHSDGWLIVDLFLSPEFPDASDYPPYVEYVDADGTVEVPRAIVVDDDERFPVFEVAAMRWSRDRAGQQVTAAQRRRVTQRLRMVYDRWGTRYEILGATDDGTAPFDG